MRADKMEAAQLGDRLKGIEDVSGSISLISTKKQNNRKAFSLAVILIYTKVVK